MNQPNPKLTAKRHSLAHLLAAAVMTLWPNTKRTIGPAIDEGFYFDFEFEQPISESDLPLIEKKMHELLPTWTTFERHELTPDKARKQYQGNEYKQELIEEIIKSSKKSEAGSTKLTFYKSGDYWDLCRGGHVDNMAEIDPESFCLYKIAGAYWRGDEKNKMLTRIYGLAFDTKEELHQYLTMQEEAKKRDHRKIGRELDLFVFSDLVGSGLPMFTPRGTVLRDELAHFAESLRQASGFQRVAIPHITKTDLYKVSGHWDKFGDELFLVKSQETSDQFALKPMNCPHHNQIYASQPRSYRDLPVKYFETTTVYRDEKSGELGGLTRVRSISQDDSHVYARLDQVEEVVEQLIDDVKVVYSTLGLKLRARLSFRDDSDKYLGEGRLWDEAQSIIRTVAKHNKLESSEANGEAAFYGPKIDFMAIDAIGREHQVATVQLDFVQPERFALEYIAEDGSSQRPVMLHCALLGSIERFLGVYIEHTLGKFPVWLAPEQVRLVTVNQEQTTVSFANKILDQANKLDLRLFVDSSNASVSKKIRAAEAMKVPYTIVIGEKEIKTGLLLPRLRSDLTVNGIHAAKTVEEFLKTVAHEAKSRVSRSSL